MPHGFTVASSFACDEPVNLPDFSVQVNGCSDSRSCCSDLQESVVPMDKAAEAEAAAGAVVVEVFDEIKLNFHWCYTIVVLVMNTNTKNCRFFF